MTPKCKNNYREKEF